MRIPKGSATPFGIGLKRLALVVALPLLVSILLACGEAPRSSPAEATAARAAPPAAAQVATAPTSGSTSPATLASGIVGAGDLKQAVAATQQALAAGGIATRDAEKVRVAAVAPASTMAASPAETFLLASEARNRATAGRLTLAELGDMLRDFGWPFQNDSPPGEQLARFLSVWVGEAQRGPGVPQNFTPLFLAELARRQTPPIDLAAGGYAPEELRFSLLELHLFAAAFDRDIAGNKGKRAESGGGWPFVSVAYAAGPCSAAKDWVSAFGDIGKAGAEVGNIALGEGASEAIGAGVEKIGLNGDTFGDAMTALGIAARLFKLVSLYSDGQVEVKVESENPLHKALPNEEDKFSAFTARAGVSDKDWQAYKDAFTSDAIVRGLRDCAGLAGLPVLPDLGDLAKEAEGWRVEWRLVEGSPEHALISTDPNMFNSNKGQLEMDLKRDGKYSASATLVVNITPETGNAHTGKELSALVTAKAEVETSSPPGLGTIVNAFKGGMVGDVLALTDALVEIASGWFQEMVQPKAYATLKVTYHSGGGWEGTITSVKKTQRSDAISTYSEVLRQTVTVTGPDTIPGLPPGAMPPGGKGEGVAFAVLKGSIDAAYEKQFNSSKQDEYHGAFERAANKYCTFGTATQSSTASASVKGEASIIIMVLPGGQASIAVNANDRLVGVEKSESVTNQYDLNDREGWCKMASFAQSGEMPFDLGLGLSVSAPVDPNNPNVLKGSTSETSDGDTVTTITWNLVRN